MTRNDANRQDVFGEAGVSDLESLDGGQHRDGWCDDAVAVEERCAQHPEDHHQAKAFAARSDHSTGEVSERHDPALALVVGLHDKVHVLERNDDHDRPEHQ